MNVLKRPMRSIKQILAVVLCFSMMFECTGMHVLAETMPLTVVGADDGILAQSVLGEESTGTTDGTSDGKDILVSGEYCEGVTWTLYDGGLFIVEGTAADTVGAGAENYTRGWEDYATDIISAKVSAKGLKNLSYFFADCKYLESVDFSGFDTSQATDMSSMFDGCRRLTSIDLSAFDTANVTNMSYMFLGCKNLSGLDVSKFNTEKVTDMCGMFGSCESLTNLDVTKFVTTQVTNMSYMFGGCSSLQSLNVSGFDTSKVTDMSGMFSECNNLSDLRLDNFNTSQVTSMYEMFYGCKGLKTLNVTGFDTGRVSDMFFMFSECENLTCLDLSSFDMSKVVTADDMILGCAKLESINIPKNLKLTIDLHCTFADESGTEYLQLPKNMAESIVLEKSENIYAKGHYYGMEWIIDNKGALSVTGAVDESMDMSIDDLGTHWTSYGEGITSAKLSASGVKLMANWFMDMPLLTDVDFSEFDSSQVTDMSCMFLNCISLKNLDLSSLNLSNLEYAEELFKRCTALETIQTPKNLPIEVDLPDVFVDDNGIEYTTLPMNMSESITIKKAIVASGIYYGMNWEIDSTGAMTISGAYDESEEGVFWGDWKSYVTSVKVTATGVKNTSRWFLGFGNLETTDFSEFDTSHVTDMHWMFIKCWVLTDADVSHFDTSQVTNMKGMFAACESLSSLDVSGFETGNVTDMSSMFGGCKSLSSLDVSSFETNNVTDMERMFDGCSNLTSLNVSTFNTGKVENMQGMFYNCSSLTKLDLSGFDCGKVVEVTDESGWHNGPLALVKCVALKQINTPQNLNCTVFLAQTMYDENGKEYTSLPTGMKETILLTLEKPVIDTNDGDDKEEGSGTADGDDKPDAPGTGDGGDKPDASGTEDGDDKAEIPGTEDGDDKPDTPDTPEDDEKEDVLHEEIIGTFKVSYVRDHVYTGKAIKPEVIVTYGAETMVEGVDYTVSYKNNMNAATTESAKAPAIIVKGKGNYASSVTVVFNIHSVEMIADNTVVSEMITDKTGKVQTVKPVVNVNGKKLVADKDYTIEYPDKMDGAYKEPGTYNIVIKGMDNYQGSFATTMTILGDNQIMASKLKVGKIQSFDYVEGTPATPTPEVSYKGTKLELGKDYAISYKNNDRAGKATLIITGLKNTEGTYVAGSVQKTFTIKGTALKKAKADYNNKATYTGSPICPEIKLTDGSKTLRPGIDYTVEYTKNVNVGKGTIVLTGQGGYTGTVQKTFTIQADASVADMLQVNFVGGKAEAAFDQKGAKPAVEVMLGDTVLKNGKDYTVLYKNNKKQAAANADKAPIVVVKGKGNYKFTKEVTFNIVQKQLADADMSVVSADKFLGSKKGYISSPIVKDGNGKKLKVNKDYKIVGYAVNEAAFDGSGDVVAGTVVTVTVEGMGNYTGQTQTTYRVANNDISRVKNNKPKLEYNGGRVVFTEEMLAEGKLELTDKASGKKLVYGTDFIVVSYKNNTKKGTATVTVQGVGEYGGTKNVKFSIVSKEFKK